MDVVGQKNECAKKSGTSKGLTVYIFAFSRSRPRRPVYIYYLCVGMALLDGLGPLAHTLRRPVGGGVQERLEVGTLGLACGVCWGTVQTCWPK